MATAEEIRARVRRADEQRIARRADAAAAVGELVDEQQRLRGKLADLDKRLGAATGQALTMMTADELATFTGRARREVEQWLRTGGRGGRRPGPSGPAGRARPERTTSATGAATEATTGTASGAELGAEFAAAAAPSETAA